MARMTKKAREQLATHLGAQSHERLVELVAELAEGDVELRNRLLLEAASAGTGSVDAASYRRSFSDALRSGSAARRDGPRTSGAWARGVHQVTERIGALNTPTEAIGPIHYVNIGSVADVAAVPYTNNFMYGSGDITNVLVQDQCPLRLPGHVGMIVNGMVASGIIDGLNKQPITLDCWAL